MAELRTLTAAEIGTFRQTISLGATESTAPQGPYELHEWGGPRERADAEQAVVKLNQMAREDAFIGAASFFNGHSQFAVTKGCDGRWWVTIPDSLDPEGTCGDAFVAALRQAAGKAWLQFGSR